MKGIILDREKSKLYVNGIKYSLGYQTFNIIEAFINNHFRVHKERLRHILRNKRGYDFRDVSSILTAQAKNLLDMGFITVKEGEEYVLKKAEHIIPYKGKRLAKYSLIYPWEHEVIVRGYKIYFYGRDYLRVSYMRRRNTLYGYVRNEKIEKLHRVFSVQNNGRKIKYYKYEDIVEWLKERIRSDEKRLDCRLTAQHYLKIFEEAKDYSDLILGQGDE